MGYQLLSAEPPLAMRPFYRRLRPGAAPASVSAKELVLAAAVRGISGFGFRFVIGSVTDKSEETLQTRSAGNID